MLALTAENEMTMNHFNVTTAFLNGKLEEEVFIEVSEYTVKALQEIVNTLSANDDWKEGYEDVGKIH